MRGLVVLAVFVAACTAQPATTSSMDASTSATAAPTEVERQQAAWEALGIDDYRVTYRVQIFDDGLSTVGDAQYVLTVVDGFMADCESNVSPGGNCGRLTDPTMLSWAAGYDPEHAVITYDPEWHLPSRIENDDPAFPDDEILIQLIEFEPITELEAQRLAWESLGIDDYRMIFTAFVLNGMGGMEKDGRFDVEVRNGEIVSCELTENGYGMECLDAISNTPVGQLFSFATKRPAEHTTVTYDTTWHFPSVVRYDDPSSVDEEFEARVITFQPLDRFRSDEVEQQKEAWRELGLSDYRIVYRVQLLNGMGGATGDGTYTLTVVDGIVTSCELDPNFEGDDCTSTVGPRDPTLFSWAYRFDPEHTTISFDPQWHLPSRIFYDVPETADEETLIELVEFDPAP